MAGEGTGTSTALKLKALDAADLTVFAACLQNAETCLADMTYLRRQRRFVMVLDRYCWEAAEAGPSDIEPGNGADAEALPGRKVQCGVHFDGILAIEQRGLDAALPTARLQLLTIVCEPGMDEAATVLLLFDQGAMIRLSVECIDARLMDIAAAGGEEKVK